MLKPATSLSRQPKQLHASVVALDRRGGGAAVAAVEFAILAPVIAMLVVGLLEYSHGMMVRQTLDDAARRACRHGILAGSQNSDLTTDVTNTLTDANLPSAKATVTIKVNGSIVNVNTAKHGDQISVQVSIPPSAVYWTINVFPANGNIASTTVVMMRQQ